MVVGCPFITCAVKRKGIEFCWECIENKQCQKWKNHREAGKHYDSFKCYQKLEDDISFIGQHGIEEFEEQQVAREALLKEMLSDFDDGRSKSLYCVAATVLDLKDLSSIIKEAKEHSEGKQPKEKSILMHSLLQHMSKEKGYLLKLRKK